MSGQDEKGSFYASIQEMWDVELHNKDSNNKVIDRVGSIQNWYSKANQYWSKSEATYNGVLGGFGSLSSRDIKYSLGFLLSLVKVFPKFTRGSVLDCGAGIGRISNELLCQVFKTVQRKYMQVDLVDQCQKLIQKSKQLLVQKKNIRHFYVKGLQQFQFTQKYDCVWIQWVFSQLNDQDAVKFLLKAKSALNEGGAIVIKENHCKHGFIVDKQDCSVTRSTELFKQLFAKADLKIMKEETQKDWPQDLFTIRMYALS